MTPARTPEELDALVERLSVIHACLLPCVERNEIILPQAAATITDLRARIAELEAEKAQWVEIERMQLGIIEHTPQSAPAHSQALTAAQGSTPPE